MSPFPFVRHLSPSTVDALVDTRRVTPRVARHLVACSACRALLDDRRALRDAARRIPASEAPADVLGRVLAARARGDRMILPDPAMPAPPRRSYGRLAAAVAAALAVAAAGLTARDRTVRQPAAESDDWLVSDSWFASVANAAEPPAGEIPAGVRFSAADRVRPRTLTYTERWTDARGRAADGARTVTRIDSARLNGAPVWRVTTRTGGGGGVGDHGERAAAESLWVTRAELRPVARHVRVSPYLRYRYIDIEQRFAAEGVTGRMQAEANDGHVVRRPIAQSLPDDAAPYITDALAPLALVAAVPSRGWEGSVSIVGWAVVSRDVSYRASLRVVGEERVTVPAGTFDCWRLVVRARGRALDYWVRKSDGVGVRSLDATPRQGPGGRGARQIVLVSDSPA